jgi:hypothetical protein
MDEVEDSARDPSYPKKIDSIMEKSAKLQDSMAYVSKEILSSGRIFAGDEISLSHCTMILEING